MTEPLALEHDPPPAGRRWGIAAFLARRLLAAALLLVALSLLVFSLMYLAPGDIAHNLIGNRPVSPDSLAAIREQYHLDDPWIVQYWKWLSPALHGDFGHSIQTRESVGSLILSRLGITAAIAGLAFVFSVVFGVWAGYVCAAHRSGWLDRFLVTGSVLGVSAPSFATGLLLLYVFAVGLHWFPFYGNGVGFWDGLWHLSLPALALAIGLAAFVLKLARAAVSRELDSDYVVFARSRGLGRARVRRVVLRNAALPIVTSVGLLIAYLFGGTVLVEVTFALPGAGSLMNEAVQSKDFPVVQALTLAVGAIVTLTSVFVDVAYLAIDPRLRGKLRRR
jgi:peptide/nickel transport system permease protein